MTRLQEWRLCCDDSLTHRHYYARPGQGYDLWPPHPVTLIHWTPRPEKAADQTYIDWLAGLITPPRHYNE